MANRHRSGHCKFFRRLIAASGPQEVQKIVERYNKDAQQTESNLIDIMIYSGGNFNYQDLISMPLPSIALLIERINEKTEKQIKARKGQS